MPERLKSRKLWIALIAQVTSLIVLFVPEHTDTITEASANVGALLLMALTGFGYIRSQGKVDEAEKMGKHAKQIEDAQIVAGKYNHIPTNIGVAAEPAKKRKKRRTTRAGVLILAMLLFIGCSTVPSDRWQQQRTALTTANILFVTLKSELDPEDVRTIATILDTARQGLEKARLLLPEGGTAFDDYLSLIDEVVVRLIEAKANQESEPNDE